MSEGSDFLADPRFCLHYWQAIATFGKAAVDAELSQAHWNDEYSDLLASVRSTEPNIRSSVVLPGKIVYSIAGRPERRDDYFASPDASEINAVERDRKLPGKAAVESWGWQRLTAQEAMIRCGAYCLFKASDSGIGYCNERPVMNEHDNDNISSSPK